MFLYFFRRNKKKRPRVRLRLRLVLPQGQALEAVGVDALGGHVDVGVVVHPKPFFSPRETMFCLFFSQLKKKKDLCITYFQYYMVSRIYTE